MPMFHGKRGHLICHVLQVFVFRSCTSHIFKRYIFDNKVSQRTANKVVIKMVANSLLRDISCIVKLIDNSAGFAQA